MPVNSDHLKSILSEILTRIDRVSLVSLYLLRSASGLPSPDGEPTDFLVGSYDQWLDKWAILITASQFIPPSFIHLYIHSGIQQRTS